MAPSCVCMRKPGQYQDPVTLRWYCTLCASSETTGTPLVYLQFMDQVIPLEIGERVQCWTVAEFYDGPGEVIAISDKLENGGTPVHLAYQVRLDKGEELWYTRICLQRERTESGAIR